jgi:hypothetical protein
MTSESLPFSLPPETPMDLTSSGKIPVSRKVTAKAFQRQSENNELDILGSRILMIVVALFSF